MGSALRVGPTDAETDAPSRSHYHELVEAAGGVPPTDPASSARWKALWAALDPTPDHPGPKGTLPSGWKEPAAKVCVEQRSCDFLLEALDRRPYDLAEAAQLRIAAGPGILEACLDGECVCGEAAMHLGLEDERAVDAARFGCEAGEADACFALGQHFEFGKGVDKDLALARDLYDMACPAVIRSDGRQEHSKRACDRIAAAFQDGDLFEKSHAQALFYATRACPHPAQTNALPCVRLATELRHDHGRVGLGWDNPDRLLYDSGLCKRTSARDACAEYGKGNR
ncbi:MAG: hypothetical protein U0414_42095 [Polyangiaceae bacterium]